MEDTLQVLFVDDEPRITAALMRAMRSLEPRWRFHAAESGAQALQMLSETALDVVVTDMRMPAMNGSELIREINIRYPWVVKIMLSGMVDKAMVDQAQRWSQRYLYKPCPPERLRDEIVLAILARSGDLPLERKQAQRVPVPQVMLIGACAACAGALACAAEAVGARLEIVSIVEESRALEVLAKAPGLPQTIVLDADSGGTEMVPHIHAALRGPAPILLLASTVSPETRARMVVDGASFCLLKPTSDHAWQAFAQRLVRYARWTVEAHMANPGTAPYRRT